jgi:hypothetical protein
MKATIFLAVSRLAMPVIWLWPPQMAPWIIGSLKTLSSTTIAE